MPHQVFLSYASADEDVAEGVCEALERAGVGCWLAPRDMLPGLPYAEEIIRALNASRALVLVLTPAAAASHHVAREVERAGSKGLPILTFKLDPSPLPPALEYFLGPSHWLDATPGPWDRHLPRLAEAVVGLLGTGRTLGPAPAPRHDTRTEPENLLLAIWDSLDPNLQDAFSLAYNKKRREGSTRISTRDFFQALVRVRDDTLAPLLASLPGGAMPEPVSPEVAASPRLLAEDPLLSDCVAESLSRLRAEAAARKITPADVFVDVAKHGHGPSVARLRQHGVGPAEIDARVRELGLSVLDRPTPT